MRAGLTLALLLAAGAAASAEESFDAQALERTALAILESAPELFSATERAALMSAIGGRSPEEVDGLLAPKASIQIEINPEGRVSASRLPQAALQMPCGSAFTWLVRISNAGFVTAPLEVRSLGNAPVALTLDGGKLSGGEIEYRALRMRIDSAGRVDVTMQFDVGRESADLGTRAQVHALVSCSGSPASRVIQRVGAARAG